MKDFFFQTERVSLEEGETLEHLHHRFSDYLGVSVKVMKSIYKRKNFFLALLAHWWNESSVSARVCLIALEQA